MTEHAMAPNDNNIHPRQQSRLREPPSSKNAQGIFPPDACLFIGNLCSKTHKEQQEREIEQDFGVFGKCYAKVKIDKGTALHGAFVQFERVEDAQKVLDRDAQGRPIHLNGRTLESSEPKDNLTIPGTARLSLQSGAPITEEEARKVLGPSGPLEGMCLDKNPPLSSDSTATCLATFTFVEDYNDAVKNFVRDSKYLLKKTQYEGNPFSNGGTPGPEPHKPHPSQAAHERGRYNGHGHHRNGPVNYGGNGRGFERRFSRDPSRRGSHQSNSSQDYQSQYSQDFNQYPDPFQPYGGPYNPSALNQPTPSRMAPGAPVFVPGQSNYAPPARTYGNPPPNNMYNGPPQNNMYNAPPNNMYNGPPPNNTYKGPAPNVGNNGDVNGYNNQQHMGNGGYNPGYYNGPYIVSTPTYNNPRPMYPNGYQQPPPPQNGYYPQYMPQGDQMNGQYPQQFGQEQYYPQGPGYFVPPPGPNMNMPYMAQPYNNAAPPYHPPQPPQPVVPPVNNQTQAPEKTDAPKEPAQNSAPENEPEQKTAAATTDDPKPDRDKSHAENGSDGALDSDKKEGTEPEEVQAKPEDPVEFAECPTPSTDATIQPKQNGNHHHSDAEEGDLTNEEQSPTENETPIPPENSPISRDSSSSPTANGGNSPGSIIPPVSEYVRQIVLERNMDVNESIVDAAIRELEEEYGQRDMKKHGVDGDCDGEGDDDDESVSSSSSSSSSSSQTSTLVGA
ncbi:hypothetical protein N7509_005257 [Penicillium cosmopolitanum]|uniref:RRM domain-containing protein n=1 Tax=Penicillium cosmopolitanum TaxID=1131564 RepID=A0A9X0B9W2_9EURO|nr:uncharacterized protein N7509_005257 [Penicillium cosmopolitanum]KAJ5397144.1 hypothetical protein N7509_005257 [Penicillium cosmopolitanum]